MLDSIKTIRKTKVVDKYALLFSELLSNVLTGPSNITTLKQSIQQTADKIGLHKLDELINEDDPMSACYIQSSFPVFLFLTYKYADSFEKAILANANAGGENVARGSLIGAVLGAHYGFSQLPQWTHELYNY